MMACSEYHDAIAEVVDGSLDPARQRDLERHLDGCASCRALLADLKSIQAAAFTLDRLEVPAHVLPRLQERIAAETPRAPARLLAFSASRAATAAWVAAAAALVVVTTAGIWSLLSSPVTPGPGRAGAGQVDRAQIVASVQAELQAATEHYEKAIQQLEQIARSEDGALDPQLAAVLQDNLQVIDQAIDESRAALARQPTSIEVQAGLFEAMRSKVALLQQTVELINEMRKGNQAEAGRLIQGLNQ